jgi:hypothetical protein
MWQSRWSSTRLLHLGACALALAAALGAARVLALKNFAIPTYVVPLQGAAAATVTLDQASASVVVVGLSSSNTRVVSVPSGVPIQPRSLTGTGVVTGAGPGCAKITATQGGRSIAQHVVVHPASTASTLKVTVPGNLLSPGAVARGTVSLGPSPVSTATITSNNPSAAAVPASIPLTRGSGAFTITAGTEGCAFITVTAGGQTVQKVVQIVYIGG